MKKVGRLESAKAQLYDPMRYLAWGGAIALGESFLRRGVPPHIALK